MKKIDLSKEKIKYVAIGDSISEGYNSRYNFGFAGKMEENKEIIGTSWPSFLARNIQLIDKNLLDSYENFSLSGSRPEDWIYFLGINNKKYNYENSRKKIEFSSWLINSNTNPERKRIKTQFKNFGATSKKDFNYLINKIQEANLITINIGANFLIPKIPIDEITKLIINKNNKNQVLTKLIKIINSVEIDVSVLLKRLKELNKNANIYLIGYNKMSGPFWNLINEFFKKINLSEDILDFCIGQLNEVLKKCSNQEDIYFISTNNKDFYSKNSYAMYNIFYDIHPTILGYKKIAQDILVKISLSDSFFANETRILEELKTFNKTYILEDINSFKNGLDFSKTKFDDKRLIEKIYGKNNELLFKNSKIKDIDSFLSSNLYFEQYLDSNNDPRQELKFSVKKSLLILLNSTVKNLDSIAEEVNNLIDHNIFLEFTLRINYWSIIANNIQKEIDNYYLNNKDELSNEAFLKIIFNQVFNLDFLAWTLSQFAKFLLENETIQFQNSKKQFIKMIINLFKKEPIRNMIWETNSWIFRTLMKDRIGLLVDSKDFENIAEHVINKIDFYELLNILIDFFFSSLEAIQKVKSFDELLKLILKQKAIKDFIYLNFKQIIGSIKISNCTVEKIMNKLNIPINSNNIKIMSKFFNNLIIFANNNQINIDVISKIFIKLLSIKEMKISLQNILEILFDLNKTEFWNKIEKIDLSQINPKNFNNLVVALDLILSNIKYDGLVFKSILNLSNPSNLVDFPNNKIKIFSLLKYLDKMQKLRKPMNQFCKLLLDNYYVSSLKIKENVYYKTFFRILLTTILVMRQMFQKNINKNIFMKGKLSIVRISFLIAGYKNGKNKDIDNLILDMFKENGNYNLIMKNENKYEKNQILRIIYNFDKTNSKDLYPDINKKKLIFDALKNGFLD
ncbi:SGNH/GDSL hydrolase family protein [Mesomycoplasma moatsii]|uniref:SGNH/GDSL hydrolase family protein n=1 Tax=Mesomycoplasma moatsii TaxID=171287 RepID=UPI0003B7A784